MMGYLKFICIFLVLTVVCTVNVASKPSKQAVEKSSTSAEHPECRYNKGEWSPCNQRTHTRSRTLTLKKGQDDVVCQKSKTIEKKCKKVCRYDKGPWSKCDLQNEMTRTDTIKNTSDASCEKTKILTKKCKKGAGAGAGDASTKSAAKGQKHKHQILHSQGKDQEEHREKTSQ